MLALGVDLGGTKIRAGLMQDDGSVAHVMECKTLAYRGSDAVISDMVKLMQQLMQCVDKKDVRGIGIGSPGPLNVSTGVVESPPNLPGFEQVPLRSRIESVMQLPTFLDNDASVAGLAEYRYGCGRGSSSMLYMTISTGIGGGVVEHGQIIRGRRCMSAEFGHVSIDAINGKLCTCGNRGCLEALASGPAIAETASRVFSRPMTTQEVGQRAHDGDSLAQKILDDAFDALGAGLVNLVHAFDPERIVLGGGVTQMGSMLLDHVSHYVVTHVMPPYRDVSFYFAHLRQDVGVIGAACLVP